MKNKKESNKERGREERKGIKNCTSMIFWEKVGLSKGPHSELKKLLTIVLKIQKTEKTPNKNISAKLWFNLVEILNQTDYHSLKD